MTSRPCLGEVALADYVRGIGSEEDAAHVAACAACSGRAALLRRVDQGGTDRIAEAVAEVDHLIARFHAALIANQYAWWRLAVEPEYQRADFVRRLVAVALDARLRNRRLAVALAKTSTQIVEVLARGARDVADLRFEAWKLATTIFREAGRYEDTGAAFVMAEDAAHAGSDPELNLASVLLSRALFCAEPDIWQPQEAAALLDRAERVFARRDESQMEKVLRARAFLLFRSGDLRAARQKFSELLARVPPANRETHMDALHNLTWVRVEMRETDPEVEHLVISIIEESVAFGQSVRVARARWMMGRIHIARGEYDQGIDLLRSAMQDIGDSDSSIRIALDWVEALLLDERHEEACRLAREYASIALALDKREPSRRRALTAEVFAYLREAGKREMLTPDLAAECARYIDRITRQRPIDFVPPMPLADVN